MMEFRQRSPKSKPATRATRTASTNLEEDNRALHALATSVEVLATKQDTIESTVQEIKTDVKELKAVPGSKWEALVKAVVTAIVGALVGFALAHAGIV